MPLRTMNDKNKTVLPNISYVLATHYDSVAAKAYRKRVDLDQEYLIPYRYTQKNFKVYEYKNLDFDCSDIKSKVVFLAYLEPSDEDLFHTWIGLQHFSSEKAYTGDMYGAVIIANEFLGILDGIEPIKY